MCWATVERGWDVAKDFLPLFSVVGDKRRLKMNFPEILKAIITAGIVAAVLYGQQQVQQKDITNLQYSITVFSTKIDKLEDKIAALQVEIAMLRYRTK